MQAWLNDFDEVIRWQLQAHMPVVWFYVPLVASEDLAQWLVDASTQTHDPNLLSHAAPPSTEPPLGWKWYALDVRTANNGGWFDQLKGLPELTQELSMVVHMLELHEPSIQKN